MALKEYHRGTSMSQMELLRTKSTRFSGISRSRIISRFKIKDQIDKTKQEVKIIDVTKPGVIGVNKSEIGKKEKYKMLKDEMARMWGMKKVTVIQVVVGALGAVSTGFEKYVASESRTCTTNLE